MYEWGFRGNLPVIIQRFLSDRYFEVQIQDVKSSTRSLRNGIPQGSVLRALLQVFAISINFLVADIPYVVDLTIVSRTSLTGGQETLQSEIDRINNLAESRGFRFSTAKTCYIHFCRLRTTHSPSPLTLKGESIAIKQKLKLLGIVFDTKLHWNDQIEYLITRCKKCVNLIRRLSGTRWRADREILIGIYRSLIESRILYAGTVYSSVRPSKITRLESLQLTALRLATGAFRTSPATFVLCDASIMPLHLSQCQIPTASSKRIPFQ
nr:unnamed protein product [Callosobruchus analis]